MEKRWHTEHWAIAPVLIWQCPVCPHSEPVKIYTREHVYDAS